MNEPTEHFDMESGRVSLENELPDIDEDELIQIHGKRFHKFDEDLCEKITPRKKNWK